jgi:predicted PurR-regulated permease PerM
MNDPTHAQHPAAKPPSRRLRQEQVLQDLDASLLVQLGLLMLAILYTLYFARFLLVPLTAALLLHQLLYPLVRRLHRHGLPLALGAGLVLAGVLFLIGLAGHFLAAPAEAWLRDAPASLHELSVRLRSSAGTGAIEELRELGEEVEELISMSEADSGIQAVRIEGQGLRRLEHGQRRLPQGRVRPVTEGKDHGVHRHLELRALYRNGPATA